MWLSLTLENRFWIMLLGVESELNKPIPETSDIKKFFIFSFYGNK